MLGYSSDYVMYVCVYAVTTWEVVRGWLDPRTQAKIEILGSGPETTAKLLEYIGMLQHCTVNHLSVC